MSFSQAQYFSKKHGGFDGLLRFIEMCNETTDLGKIAVCFNISASQVCRLRSGLLEQIWRPRRGVIEYIEFQMGCLEREVNWQL